VSLLLTGDVTRTRELAMVRFWRAQLKADVLVAAHHGSTTSNTWTMLKWVQPRYVLISAARASRFGHPHRDVVSRFSALGAHVINSAKSGTFTLSIFDSGAVSLHSTRGPWLPFWLQL
jgi:competence protein ComEC